MLLFSLLVVPVLAALAADDRSYQRRDPMTGGALLCDRCAPGSRMRAHCTRSQRTECVACEPGLFTEFWNYIPHCLLCDACSDHQRVARPCNRTANTVCECEPGFYWDQYFCKRHTGCKPGHGVKTAGTPHRDTVCEVCADGWFADVTRAHAVCVPHSVCDADQHQMLPGARWHDSVCASCRTLAERGWAALFQPVLTGLHIQYKTPIHRLQQQVTRRLQKKLRKRGASASSELLNLSLIREDSDLGYLAHRISQRVRSVQQHCRNSTAV
ncbi:hypothetical protein R3I94_018486 [Phoxinus phoxinus]